MRIVIDTTRVTTPVSNFVGRIADSLREASLNRQARKANRQMDNLNEILVRAERLRHEELPPLRTVQAVRVPRTKARAKS